MTRLSNHVGTRARLMSRMLDRCNVELSRLAAERLGLTLASTLRTCEMCRNADSCKTWLAATAGERDRKPPSFCPNARVFEAMIRNSQEDPRREQGEIST